MTEEPKKDLVIDTPELLEFDGFFTRFKKEKPIIETEPIKKEDPDKWL